MEANVATRHDNFQSSFLANVAKTVATITQRASLSAWLARSSQDRAHVRRAWYVSRPDGHLHVLGDPAPILVLIHALLAPVSLNRAPTEPRPG